MSVKERVVHYGAARSPLCYPDRAVRRPWCASWWEPDITCVRCLTRLNASCRLDVGPDIKVYISMQRASRWT